MRFDAPTFAGAWLAVAQASSADKDLLTLNKTVAVEEYVHGVRLVATDRFVLLTAWVPNMDTKTNAEPALDEAPDRTVLTADHDGRVKSLLGYVLSLANREDPYVEGQIELRLTFDARLPAGSEGDDSTLDGMEPIFTVFEIPDTEKVWCPVMQAEYPQWRSIIYGFMAESTSKIVLNPELVERVCKARKWTFGNVHWNFGGPDRAAMVDFYDSDPHLTGVVMPVRWLAPGEQPPENDVTPPAEPSAVVSIAAADLDPLLAEAITMVVSTQFGSPSMLQRKLKVGVARARKLMEQLEQFEIVGPQDGIKARQVLLSPDGLDQVIARLQDGAE